MTAVAFLHRGATKLSESDFSPAQLAKHKPGLQRRASGATVEATGFQPVETLLAKRNGPVRERRFGLRGEACFGRCATQNGLWLLGLPSSPAPEEFIDGSDKVNGAWWRPDPATQDHSVGNIFAIVSIGIRSVLMDDVPIEINACEESLTARVGEELGVGKLGCGGLRIASNRTSRHGCIGAQFHLVLEQIVKAVVGHSHEDEIGRLTANLETEAGAFHLDKDGCAPAMRCTAGGNTLSIFGAYDEGALLEAWNDGDALRFGGNVKRNAFVGRSHQGVKDLVGSVDAAIELAHAIFLGRGDSGNREEESDGGQAFMHSLSDPLQVLPSGL